MQVLKGRLSEARGRRRIDGRRFSAWIAPRKKGKAVDNSESTVVDPITTPTMRLIRP